jgi:hypothetical protein
MSSAFQKFVEDRSRVISLVIVVIVVLVGLLLWLKDYNSPEQRMDRCLDQVSDEYLHSNHAPQIPALPGGVAYMECDQRLGIPIPQSAVSSQRTADGPIFWSARSTIFCTSHGTHRGV